MTRKVHKICITEIDDVKRMKVIDIISAALVKDSGDRTKDLGNKVIVLKEAHASEAALDAIQESVTVFLICDHESPPKEQEQFPEQEYESDLINIGDIVKSKDGSNLRSGSSSYAGAVCMSLKPFVLISELGDMRWYGDIKAEDFYSLGPVSEETYQVCCKRFKSGN